MFHPLIIRRDSFGQRHACFEDEPQAEFSGDWPSVAFDRLIEAFPERPVIRETIAAMHGKSTMSRLVFTIEGSDVIENRAQLRQVFARYR
ncbi:MAG: hypothetical protein IT428_15770 [Planctomycetaceae bacterium]|nr:hypothetical protein [Planctomycetaceae bacterium]